MASRSSVIRYFLTADAEGVKRGTQEAESAFTGLGEHAHSILGETTKLAGELSLAFLGFETIKTGVEEFIHVTEQAQASQARMTVALKNAGISLDDNEKHIEGVIAAQSRMSGFTNQDLQDSFSNFIRTTHNVNDALHLNQIAMDVARTRGMSLADAQSLLARVYNGNTRGLKALGIEVKPVTDAQDKLRESTTKATKEQLDQAKAVDQQSSRLKALQQVQDAFKGQAEAFGKTAAGSVDRFKASWDEFIVTVTKAVMPALADVFNKLNDLVDWLRKEWPTVAPVVAKAWNDIKDAVEQVVDWLRTEIVPRVQQVIQTLEKFWHDDAEAIKSALTDAWNTVKSIMKAIGDAIQLVLDVISGHWSKAWGDLKGIVSSVLDGVWNLLKGAAATLGTVALTIGKAIAQGILTGLEDLGIGIIKIIVAPLNAIIHGINTLMHGIVHHWPNFPGLPGPPSFLKQTIPDIPTPSFQGLGGGGGGDINAQGGVGGTSYGPSAPSSLFGGGGGGGGGGTSGGFDTSSLYGQPFQSSTGGGANANSPGPGGAGAPVGHVAHTTRGNADLQHVQRALDFARRQLGKPYVWGAGHSFGEHSSYDCSGLAANIAAQVPGYAGGMGDTDALYAHSTAASGSEPILWGFCYPGAVDHGVKFQWGHVFTKVQGQVFNAHYTGTKIDQQPSPNPVWRVPHGLENLHPGTVQGVARTQTTISAARSQQIDFAQALGASGGAGAQALIGGAAGTTGGLAGQLNRLDRASKWDQLRADQAIQTSTAPAQLKQEMQQLDADKRLLALLKQKRQLVLNARATLNRKLGALQRDLQKAQAAMTSPKLRAAAIRTRQSILQAIASLKQQRVALNAQLDDFAYQIAVLGDPGGTIDTDQQTLDDELQALGPEQVMPDGSVVPLSTSSDTSSGSSTPSPDVQAALNWAMQTAQNAWRGQLAADAYAYALGGTGDIGSGGGPGLGPVFNINTLHPADPATLQAIAQAANAGNTLAGYRTASSGPSGI